MVEHYNGDESAFLRGSSPHNQRIERLWKDVNRIVGHFFKAIFTSLENAGFLNINSERDLAALHYIFSPRIQQSLDIFTSVWNSHRVSTESRKTPRQLWVLGVLYNGVSGTGIEDVVADEFYGVDPEICGFEPGLHDAVVVGMPNHQQALAVLPQYVDPPVEDNEHGISLFLLTRQVLSNLEVLPEENY